MIDGTIVDGQRARLDRHLSRCPNCEQTLSRFQTLDERLGRMALDPVPEGFSDRVIDTLRAAGMIRQPATAARRVGFLGGFAARLTAPAVALVVLLVLVALFPSAVGTLKGLAGTGVVFVTDSYLAIRDTMASVEVLNPFFAAAAKIPRTTGTVLNAGFSLLASAGETLMLPALGMLLMLTLGATWYVRNRKRGAAEHATFSF